jgi:hypothetical protein
MTTCRSCENTRKSPFFAFDCPAFRDSCTRNFQELRLSPKFLAGSHLYELASTVAGDRVGIMQEEDGAIRYVDMVGLMEEMTDECTMRGVRHDVQAKGLGKEELVMPYLPGAFV